jgi:tetrahydrodipicolinate N-succinyltransferase
MRACLIAAAVAVLGLSLCACAVVDAGVTVVGAGARVVGTAASVTADVVTAPFGGSASDDKKTADKKK